MTVLPPPAVGSTSVAAHRKEMTSRGSDSSLTVGLLQGCICLNSPRSQAGGFVQLPRFSATPLLPRSYIKPKNNKKTKQNKKNSTHRNRMPIPAAGCVRCQTGGHLQGQAQQWAGAWAGGAEVMWKGSRVQQDCCREGPDVHSRNRK